MDKYIFYNFQIMHPNYNDNSFIVGQEMKELSNENGCFREGDLKDNIMGCWLLHCNLSFPRQPLGVTHVNTLPE